MLKYQVKERDPEAEALQASYEGFMDVLKNVAKKVTSGFAATLKKITDITVKGLEVAEHSDWAHVLGKNNPFCSETDHILTFRQATELITKAIPQILEKAKLTIPVFDGSKDVSTLPSQDDIVKIRDTITEFTDYKQCETLQYGPGYDGNSGCNWSKSNTKQFVGTFIRVAKTGLPQEVIAMTADEKKEGSTSAERDAIAIAKWCCKAYGKCMAEMSRTLVKLADTIGLTQYEKEHPGS